MPIALQKVIDRVRLSKGLKVTLHVDPIGDCIRVLRNGQKVGEITRRQVNDSPGGRIDAILVRLLS